MKHKLLQKLISALFAFALSFALSAAATMSVVTAFQLGIDTDLLLRTCAWAAFACTVCYSLPLRLVPLGGGAALLGYYWKQGALVNSAEALLNRISRQYDRAYGWGIIRWGYRTADEMEPDMVLILCILAAAIALLTAWAICRRKTAIPAILTSLLLFAACFVVNDTIPDTLWLYLMLLVLVLLMMTGYVRRQDEYQGNRLLIYLTPTLALGLLVLFLAIPREGYNRQDVAKRFADSILHSDSMQLLLGHMDEGGAISGTTDSNAVNLRSVGYRLESQAQVLQVTAPYTGTLYLRGRALDTYDGLSWSASDMDYTAYQWPTDTLQTAGEVTLTTRFAHRMLYVPYYTDTMQLLNLDIGMENDKTLTQYSFSVRQQPQTSQFTQIYPTETCAVPAAYQSLLEQYKSSHQLEPKVQKWATAIISQLLGNTQSPYHKAQAIASYVRHSASYNTRTGRMPGSKKDFAQWFLEESSTGYCVHFATAATVLLQAAGIPARYVTGYYAQVTEGETITIYSDQAHAWTEYWLPGFGWTVLEATPADFAEEPEETTQSTTAETLPQTTNTTLPSATTAPAPQQPTQQEAPAPSYDWVLWLLLTLTGICALVTVAEGQRRLRRFLRHKKRSAAAPNQRALLYWQDAVLYARLLNETPDKALYTLAERAKFSQHTLTDDQLQQFEAYAAAAEERLRHQNLLRRLYYRLILAIY